MTRSLTCVVVALFASTAGIGSQGDTSPHTEHFLQANGVKLHYLDWGGTGQPLVLLTGYGSPAHVFDSLAPRLTSAFRVVALTRRGRALSDASASGYDLGTLTGDVRALLDALKFGRVHLVAHSLGGAEATQLATLYPDKIASVVYLDAALDAAVGEAVLKDSPVPGPQPAPGTPWALVREWWTSYTPDFSRVRCPSLAFFAITDKPPVPPKSSDELRQRADEFWRKRGCRWRGTMSRSSSAKPRLVERLFSRGRLTISSASRRTVSSGR
jgi:pimeloyl-ACP methyl ester carboxylesterase